MPAVPTGITSAEAARRSAEFGPNAVVEPHPHPIFRILRHFWSPVPWMLEATIVLQLAVYLFMRLFRPKKLVHALPMAQCEACSLSE